MLKMAGVHKHSGDRAESGAEKGLRYLLATLYYLRGASQREPAAGAKLLASTVGLAERAAELRKREDPFLASIAYAALALVAHGALRDAGEIDMARVRRLQTELQRQLAGLDSAARQGGAPAAAETGAAPSLTRAGSAANGPIALSASDAQLLSRLAAQFVASRTPSDAWARAAALRSAARSDFDARAPQLSRLCEAPLERVDPAEFSAAAIAAVEAGLAT
jgi:hypothetical protein